MPPSADDKNSEETSSKVEKDDDKPKKVLLCVCVCACVRACVCVCASMSAYTSDAQYYTEFLSVVRFSIFTSQFTV